MTIPFDHEKLRTYQRALDFVDFAGVLLETLPKGLAAYAQLDRASTSIPLNIAEGNGKFSSRDRCRFFDISRGSALECAAVLDVLVRRKKVDQKLTDEGKVILVEVVSLLVGLIRSQDTERVYEEQAGYGDGVLGD
ncbi:MAG: four helix bundle protein [Puniceicoccaceae bacterium]|nr:MAG: four helix bundle protein [Puniceicoccaceae bacterium]